jgi:hypothetical protein
VAVRRVHDTVNDITGDELIRARLFADPEQVADRLFALTQSTDDRVAVDAIRLVLDRAYGHTQPAHRAGDRGRNDA